MTTALIDYWQRLPAQSAAARRQHLALACEDVSSGRLAPDALLTFALGDVDDEIVRQATHAYLEAAAGRASRERAPAVTDACEWVRRDLALNRGAVFAALLESGEAAVIERLGSLRLALPLEVVATVCRLLGERPSGTSVRFLREWHELLAGSVDPTLRRHLGVIEESLRAPAGFREQVHAAPALAAA
jgi:hypothetical protein